MKNVEVKSRVVSLAAARSVLEDNGGSLVWIKNQTDTFYEASVGWLKIREEDGSEPVLISYRRSTSEAQRTSEYFLTKVVAAEMKDVLGHVLKTTGVVQKRREFWKLDNTKIHLDSVVGLGDFVELETIVSDVCSEKLAAIECSEIVKMLGLNDCVTVPYMELQKPVYKRPSYSVGRTSSYGSSGGGGHD